MAIKGKGKTRRRTVTSGPKPAYVEPPKPLWRRRWFQAAAAAVVLVGIVIAVIAVLIHIGNVNEEKAARARRDKERGIVETFGSQVDGALNPVSTAFGTTRTPLPDLVQNIGALKAGKPIPAATVTLAQSAAKLSKSAASTIQSISTSELISGHADLLPLIDSQDFLGQSLTVFQQAATAVVAASKATGEAQTALIKQAQSLLPVAQRLFSDGYQKLTNVRTKLGVQAAPPPPPPPSPAPSASASATPTATPTPSGSPKAKASSTPGKKKKKH
jgi:hypothetical protein